MTGPLLDRAAIESALRRREDLFDPGTAGGITA